MIHIAGPLKVQQIKCVHNINRILMITDDTRILVSCDSNHLTNLTKCTAFTRPSLTFSIINVKNLCEFHMFEVNSNVHRTLLCVAAQRQIVIMKYDDKSQEFIMSRVLDTAQPVGCMLFTEHTLIVGADKLFEIDLRTYEAEEFLDRSDNNISHAVQCHGMGSYPQAILRTSSKPSVEYLICFNEFAAFVDEYGRASRSGDIKWSHPPISFHYQTTYLYVINSHSVDIFAISPETCLKRNSLIDDDVICKKIELDNVVYLGSSKKGIYVRTHTDIVFLSAASTNFDDLSLISESDVSDQLQGSVDRFSFTSSLVNCLDDHVSDAEHTEGQIHRSESNKKVTFANTDL